MDRGNWTTHKIVAVGPDRDEVLGHVADDATDEDIYVLTDMSTGQAQRVETAATRG